MSVQPYELKHARINATADGANTVIAAVAGSSIIVLGYGLTVNAAGVITFQDSAGSPAVFASFELVDSGGISYAGTIESPAFRVAEGNGFVISNATGVDTLGHITYVLKRGRS